MLTIDENYTPLLSSVGGLLLAIAVTIHLVLFGRLTGLSGIVDGVFRYDKPNIEWKLSFLTGIMVCSSVMEAIFPTTLKQQTPPKELNMVGYAIAGFAVGFGTRLGNGCTSGHGLCGMSRFSTRSFVNVLVFLTTAIATASLMTDHQILLEPRSKWDEAWTIAPAISSSIAIIVFAILLWQSENKFDSFATFIISIIFTSGLIVGGMGIRHKIIKFLDISKDASWDPSLLFVLFVGVGVLAISFRVVNGKLDRPLYCSYFASGMGEECNFQVPNSRVLDVPLILGGWLFGMGWGFGGLCPGPALIMADRKSVV